MYAHAITTGLNEISGFQSFSKFEQSSRPVSMSCAYAYVIYGDTIQVQGV
jgi:hypothetical protein